MIRKVRFEEIAEIFTGVRVKRYQKDKGKGLVTKQPILKKTYSENSSKLECDYEEVSKINENKRTEFTPKLKFFLRK